MAKQMRRLAETAQVPNVTIQVLPGVAHLAGANGFIIADKAAYADCLPMRQCRPCCPELMRDRYDPLCLNFTFRHFNGDHDRVYFVVLYDYSYTQ